MATKLRLSITLLATFLLLLAGRAPVYAQAANPVLPSVVRACPGPHSPGTADCHALVRTDIQGPDVHANNGQENGAQPNKPGRPGGPGNCATTTSLPTYGYRPSDLQSAYNISTTSSQTVAIVDAYDDPCAESDLAVYRSAFNLGSCTTSNGCFRKVNQGGGTSYPSANTGWAEEISLDLDMVSAICPSCHILLVEASNNSFSNLDAAVNRAASVPGVVAISNSYGGGEFSSEGSSTYDSSVYNHPGIAITASSGDGGYGVEFPAASEFVTAVGGTSLSGSSGNWSETVWGGAGSGCSAYIARPAWQTGAPWNTISSCSNRTVADVAAVADPNTGVAVYDSYGERGWLEFGGTSVASPIIASVYALAGNTTACGGGACYPYGHTGSFRDITSGSNGSCGNTYLCTGETGYDGPTGLGTPNTAGGF